LQSRGSVSRCRVCCIVRWSEIRGDRRTRTPCNRLSRDSHRGAGELDEVQLGDSDSTKVGDWVVSLASPYELKQSVSAGIVSATDRWVPGTPHPLIQNDVATNPGSSGGDLLNLQGKVVGVITGGFSTGREFQGIGLAVPVNTVKQVITELGKSTPTRRAYLGCETQKLSPDIAQQLGLPVAGGLYVKDVEKESPAARAGIKEGDVISHFSDQAINDTFRPEQLFDDPIPGNTYTFTLFRNGQSEAVSVQMGYPPDRNNIVTTRANLHSSYSSEHFDDLLGLGVDKLTTDVARQLHFSKDIQGVLVTDVAEGSIAYKEGVAAGMVVLRINSLAIRDIEDYRQATSASSLEKPVLILLQSNEGKHLAIFER